MSFEIENGVLIKYYEEPGVTDVVIPDGVTSIGDRVFYMRWSLTSIIIPEGVKEIGNEAFYCCEKIISITIPDSVISIGNYAFFRCKKIISITIPNGVTSIGNNAFCGCISLASVTIPDSVTSIENNFFAQCYNIEEIVANPAQLPNAKWKQMAMYTFFREPEKFSAEQAEGCKKYLLPQRKRLLPEIFANDYVHVIRLFADAGKITKSNVRAEYLDPAIEAKATQCVAFLMDWENKNVSSDDKEKLIEKELTKDPFNVTDMKKFWSYKKLEDGTLCLTSYKGAETDVVIPERIGKNKVTLIEKELFSPNKYGPNSTQKKIMEKISSVFIPDSVICIGDDAFFDCGKLADINVAAGNSAYSSENGILFNKSRTEILRYPERKTDASYVVPSSVTRIRDNAFRNCSSLANITIPESVTSIGNHAFSFCKSLTSINIPNGVTGIGEDAFNGCRSLKSVNIPNGIKSVEPGAFFPAAVLQTLLSPTV